jgi:hypothetical protein
MPHPIGIQGLTSIGSDCLDTSSRQDLFEKKKRKKGSELFFGLGKMKDGGKEEVPCLVLLLSLHFIRREAAGDVASFESVLR